LHDFVSLLDRYDLGYGETERIAFCISEGLSFCSGDRRARKSAEGELGASRVVGTLYLLRECVRSSLLTKAEAKLAYERMKVRGAFLPDWPDRYLDALSSTSVLEIPTHYFFFPAFTFAQPARCAAAILLRPAAEIARFTLEPSTRQG
jgi:hypothetical protein